MHKVYIVPHFVGRISQPEPANEFYPHCVGKGWLPILLKLTDQLFYLGWDGGLCQVKEKFGTLRFYWRNNITDPMKTSIAWDLVAHAEHLTSYTCEDCGEYGRSRDGGWIKTQCDKCYKESERKQNERENSVPHPVD